MADNTSDAGSRGPIEDDEEEGVTVPKVIGDEYFNDLVQKANLIVKNLQVEEQYAVADDTQRLLLVAQSLKTTAAEQLEANLQMHTEVSQAVGKVAAAFELSQSDQDTIERLKAEIESAWRQTDAAQMREQTAQQQLHETHVRLEQLQREIKKAAKRDDTDELGANLAKHKDDILRERDRLNAEVEELNTRLQIQRLYTEEIERKREESEKKNKDLYKLLDDTSSEAYQKIRMVDHLKQDIVELNAEKTTSEAEKSDLQHQLNDMRSSNSHLTNQLATNKTSLERKHQALQAALAKDIRLAGELEAVSAHRRQAVLELGQVETQLKLRDSECNRLLKDNVRLDTGREQLQKKLLAVERTKSDLVQDAMKMKATIAIQEKEHDSNKKAFDKIKRFGDDMLRERDLVRKDLLRMQRLNGEQAEAMLTQLEKMSHLETQIKQHLEAAQKQRALLARVEKERDKNAEEVQSYADRLEQCHDDLHAKNNYIAILNENAAQMKAKMANLQQQFETSRSERNTFQRDLMAANEDRIDLRERIRIAVGQCDQLKEDLATKESELVRAYKTIEKLEKDKIVLRLEIQTTTAMLQQTRAELRERKLENERLYKTLADDEMRLVKLKQQLDSTANDKDLIGTQMVRRNDEIGLLNEKLQIVTMALDRGEAQYNKRLDDIRLLKIEIANLRSQRNLLTRGLANTADMRQEVLQLNRVLTQERVRARALEQEMSTPMNVHRWRKLGGKDPDRMELVEKVGALQKRVLRQTVSAVEREGALQQTHQMYEELKVFMLKLPDHTVREELTAAKRCLTAKTRRMKALAAELKCNEMDDRDRECNVQQLRDSCSELQQELFKLKKDNQRLRERLSDGQPQQQQQQHDDQQLQSCPPIIGQPTNAAGYKTLGSGYRIPTISLSDIY